MFVVRRVVCVSLVWLLAFAATPSPVPSNAKNDARIAAALQRLQRYQISHSIKDLDAAVDGMSGTLHLDAYAPERFRPGQQGIRSTIPAEIFKERRRVLVRAWIRILKEIELAYDPTYDPNDFKHFPTNCVLPEDGSVTCNVDPPHVTDPQKRAAYAAALAANKKRLEQTYYYHELHNIDQGAMTMLFMSLDLLRKIAPEGVSDDFGALDAMVRQAGLSNVRRALIDAYFYATPIPSQTPQHRNL